MQSRQVRAMLKGLAMIAVLAAAALAVRATGLEHVFNTDWIDSEIRGHGLAGLALFTAAGTLFTAVGLPRQAVSFMAGYAFGFASGTLAGVLATALGAVLAFWYARLFGRGPISRRFGPRIAKADAFLRENTFATTIIIRLLPVGSNVATNLAAGVSSVRATPYLTASAIGFIPQTAIFALLGSGFQVDPAWRITVSVALFAASSWLGWTLYRRNKAARAMANGEGQ